MQSECAKVEKTAPPRVGLLPGKKGRNLRFASTPFLTLVANPKKMNTLRSQRIFSAFGRLLAVPPVDSCHQVIEK